MALVVNTLLSAVPRQLAGGVGAWRGLVHNFFGVGAAVASAFAVGMLIASSAAAHPEFSDQVLSRVNINDANIMTSEPDDPDALEPEWWAKTSSTTPAA
ncbi:hypothetical protein ACOM2C_02540 [Pseudarthrobacter sp. So.54]